MFFISGALGEHQAIKVAGVRRHRGLFHRWGARHGREAATRGPFPNADAETRRRRHDSPPRGDTDPLCRHSLLPGPLVTLLCTAVSRIRGQESGVRSAGGHPVCRQRRHLGAGTGGDGPRAHLPGGLQRDQRGVRGVWRLVGSRPWLHPTGRISARAWWHRAGVDVCLRPRGPHGGRRGGTVDHDA